MQRHFRLVTKLCRLLVVVSVLMTSVPAPMSASTRAARSASTDTDETSAGSPTTFSRQPQALLVPDPGESDRPPLRSGGVYSSTLFLPFVARNHNAGTVAEVTLEKHVEPWVALPGDVVTYTLMVASTGGPVVQDGVLVDCVPEQIEVLEAEGAEYYTETRELHWDLGQLDPGQVVTVTLRARVVEGNEMMVVENRATFTADPQITEVATATLRVGEAVTATLTSDGGEVSSPDEHVRLLVPPGAMTETTALTLTVYVGRETGPDVSPNPETGLVRFDIDAVRVSDGEPVTSLAEPVQLVVNIHQEAVTNTWDHSWYIAYRDPEEADLWHEVETHVYDESGLISASTDHFSSWSAGSHQVGWLLAWQEPTISAFSGAATYQYPIALPPGRGGLQPNIDISYSSRGVDGHTKPTPNQGPIGLGWSINTIEIARKRVRTKDTGGNVWLVHPDSFSLVIDGAGYDLVTDEDTGNAIVRYYVTDAPGMFVERRYDPLATDANLDRIYWIVKTPGGTVYRLGYTPDSASGQTMSSDLIELQNGQHAGASASYSGIRWLVDTVTDVHGNQVQYEYKTWTENNRYQSHKPDWNVTYSATSHNLIYRIRYNYASLASDAYTRVSGAHATLIAFDHTADHRIDKIKLYHGDLAQPYSVIDLALSFTDKDGCGQWVRTWMLKSITQYDGTGTRSLPPTTFNYDLKPHAIGCYQYAYLEQAHNGYGGRTRFTYESDGRRGDTCSGACVPPYGHSYIAATTETWDGLHAQPAVVEYDFSTPCYDQRQDDNGRALGNLPGAFNCPTRNSVKYGGSLLGFATTIQTVKGYQGEILGQQTTHFSQVEETMGKPTLQEFLNTDGSVVLESTQTGYTTTPSGPTTFTYADQITSTDHSVDPAISTRVSYDYDDYGNVTGEYYHGDTGLSGDERLVVRAYLYNESAWIVSLPAWERVYDGLTQTPDGTEAAMRAWGYDGVFDLATPPAKGNLTLEAAYHTISADVQNPAHYYATRYGYDLWGNVAVVTDTLGRVATTGYDGTHHQFPIETCAAVGTDVEQCSVTEYYGVNQSSACISGGYYYGAVCRAYGPNGENTATRYVFDSFGRLTRMIQPGDSESMPTLEYVYGDAYDYGGLRGVQITQIAREQSGIESAVQVNFSYYDGLGRLVETLAERTDGGEQVLAYTAYDALGRAQETYVPYAVNEDFWNFKPLDDVNRPHTTTDYDALGRVEQVTNPDGTNAHTGYQGWKTAVIDANDHQRIQKTDAFGRLVKVFEFEGAYDQPNWDAMPYATTHYAYDTLDNLTTVTDTLDNVTTMTYDTLGRKVAMDDPDMGEWYYHYDAVGSLFAQVDAKRQAINFYYDELSRLVGKTYYEGPVSDPETYQRPGDPGVYTVAYAYDEPNHGYSIGQRTSITYTGGFAVYRYDERGRVVEGTRRFDAIGDYTTAYTYDAMNRVATMTYPDGEQVTQTYDDAGLPESLSSNLGETFVTGTDYNALGQIEWMDLDNGLRVDYEYYSADDGNNRLHQISIQNLLDLTYTYDDVGNVISIVDGQAPNGMQTLSFQYDPLDRLRHAHATGSAEQGGYTHDYTYDEIGNLRSKDGVTYTYPDPGQPQPHAVTRLSDGSHFVYDANGNMTQRVEISGTQTITYVQEFDIENRLVVVTATVQGVVTPTVTRFTYDGDGARVAQLTEEGVTIYVGEYFEGFFPGLTTDDWLLAAGYSMLDTGYAMVNDREPVANDPGAADDHPQPNADARWTPDLVLDHPPAQGKPGLAAPVIGPEPIQLLAGGTMLVSTSGDFEIKIDDVVSVMCPCHKLYLASPAGTAGWLFGGGNVANREGDIETRYFSAGSTIRLAYYHCQSNCSSTCNDWVPQPVYSNASDYVDLETIDADHWRIGFEDYQGGGACCRDLWVRVRRINQLTPPTWVDTGPECSGENSRTLEWTSVDGWWYRVERATDSDFTQNVVSQDMQATASTTFYTFDDQNTTGEYYYRVQCRGGNNDDPTGWITAGPLSHDHSPPVTDHDLDGTPGNDNWYVSSVQVTLNATQVGCGDPGSTFHDYGGWQTYGDPFQVNGSNTVHYYSQDDKGNVENPQHSVSINIDTVSPVIAHGCGTGWNPNCSPTATDTGSGLAQSRFYVNGVYRGAANQTYSNVCGTYNLPNGYNDPRVWATDNAGKVADQTWDNVIRCDRTDPVVSTGLGSGWNPGASPSATDTTSGIKTRTFYVDGTARTWQTYSNLCSELGLSDGDHTARVDAEDNAGNTNATGNETFSCDRTDPVVGTGLEGEWNPEASPSAADTASGIRMRTFYVDGASEAWQDYTNLCLELGLGNGNHTARVDAEDNADNTDTTGNETFSCDDAPPSGTMFINTGDPYTNDTAVTLNLDVSDTGGSDMHQMRFRNAGGSWSDWVPYRQTWSWTLSSGDGDKTVYGEFEDNAGNTLTLDDTITLDTTPPDLEVDTPTEGALLQSNVLWVEGYQSENKTTIDVLVSPSGATDSKWLSLAGNFSLGLENALIDGENTVTITATDQVSNSTTIARQVTLDRAGPEVTNVSPEGAITQAQPAISADFTEPVDTARVMVWLDGKDVTDAATVTANGFSYVPDSLESGDYEVEVEVYDAAGNRGEGGWTFTVDVDTWVEIVAPGMVNASPIDVEVWGEVGADVVLTVGGASYGPQTLIQDGEDGKTLFENVSLQDGDNTLTITATDGFGHEADHTVSIELDTTRPQPTASANPMAFAPLGHLNTTQFNLDATPPANETITGWRLDVTSSTGGTLITATEGVYLPVAVVWDGRDLDGLIVTGGDYLYTLIVTASNGLDKSTYPQTVWVVDGPPPAPTITVPASDVETTFDKMRVEGIAQPGSAVGLFDTCGYITDTVEVDEEGHWRVNRSLFGGHNEIYAVAENAYGPGPESNPVVVSLVPNPPLYPPAIALPPTIKNGQDVTFSTNARDDNPSEGRPTVAVTVTTAVLPGEEVALNKVSSTGDTGAWEAVRNVSGANDGDYRVFFVGVDGDGYVGDGKTQLRVQDVPQPPEFHYPTEPIIRSIAALQVDGWAQPHTTLQLYDNGALVGTVELGSIGDWIVPLILSDGTHTITATATDNLGQVSPTSTAGLITVDTVAPDVPTLNLLVPYYHKYYDVSLSWSAEDPSPGTGVAGYTLQHRAGTGDWQDLLTDENLTETTRCFDDGVHTFRVRARDGAGNLGEYSPEVSVMVDTIPPDVTLALSESSDYAHVNSTTIYYGDGGGSFMVTADASDDASKLKAITFPDIFTGGDAYPHTGADQAIQSHDYTFYGDDTFSGAVTITATDRAENPGTATFDVVRDTAAPTSQITPEPPHYTNANSVEIPWTSGDSGGSGVQQTTLWVRVPGGSWRPSGVPQSGEGGQFDFDFTNEGRYDFATVSEDNVGNAEADPTNDSPHWTVYDVTSPTVNVTAQVQGDDIRVTWEASDPLAGSGQAPGSGLNTCTLEVQEDQGPWEPFSTACAGTNTHDDAQPGHIYTFRLTATDNAGNPAGAEAQAGTLRVTKYYYHGGQRVTMRRSTASGSVVYYLHGDHLGSTSLTTYGSGPDAGEVVARQLYYPYGEERWSSGTLPTDYQFTGQRNEASLGLYDYNARFYDAALGRFISADTIVPDPGNPQAFNRYSYVLGNPLRYSDPSGHLPECSAGVGDTCQFPGTYWNGVGVWRDDPRPGVQERMREQMDPIHFLDPIKMYLTGAVFGTVLQEAWNFIWAPSSLYLGPTNVGSGGWDVPPPNVLGDPGFGPEPGFHGGGGGDAASDPKSWNEFQAANRGRGWTKAQFSQRWAEYKAANGIQTGTARSSSARASFLREFAASGNAPKEQILWLQQGRVPPGYAVDHRIPLSVDGPDVSSNMRLVLQADHVIHHRYYHPWTQ